MTPLITGVFDNGEISSYNPDQNDMRKLFNNVEEIYEFHRVMM
jgi:hypothetical protein